MIYEIDHNKKLIPIWDFALLLTCFDVDGVNDFLDLLQGVQVSIFLLLLCFFFVCGSPSRLKVSPHLQNGLWCVEINQTNGGSSVAFHY